MLSYCQLWTEPLGTNFNNIHIKSINPEFENVICKMAFILSEPQFANDINNYVSSKLS